jgi:phospholipase/carboxylesterase
VGLTTYRIERPSATRLLFLLHGWSAEQHHLAAYVPLVDPGDRFSAICPRAPHDLAGGDGAAWYRRDPSGPDPVEVRAALDGLDELITAETAKAGLATEQCVIGGFSQGGFLAMALGARAGAARYGGLWAMCCQLHQVDGLDIDAATGTGTPALVQYGEKDTIISPDRTQEAAAMLSEAGWPVTLRGYDMAHSQRIEMMIDARDWLAAIP